MTTEQNAKAKRLEEQAETGWNVSDWQNIILENLAGKTNEELREIADEIIFGKKLPKKVHQHSHN